MPMPNVSVVIPCYNAEKYLRECMDSVVNQTLRELEILCVNDGSTDSTAAILEEYAREDPRVRILSKENTGYGDSVNRGFAAATGEYLGIVEADDFAEPDMFEILYRTARSQSLDVCKAGFFRHSAHADIPDPAAAKLAGSRVLCPMTDFRDPKKQTAFFQLNPAIWAGIYRREFLEANQIRFLTTPGASYQDAGFCFKVWSRAKRVMILDKCLLHYRVDNDQSSVHNPGKVYCICQEFAGIRQFLEESPQGAEALPILVSAKYGSYLWNYERLSEPLQAEFIRQFHQEFVQHRQEGSLRREYFSWHAWNNLQMILLDPDRYHQIQSRKLRGEDAPDFYDSCPEHRPIKIKPLYRLACRAAVASQYIREAGLQGIVRRLTPNQK